MKKSLKIILLIVFCGLCFSCNFFYEHEDFAKLFERKCGSLRPNDLCDLSNTNLSGKVLKNVNLWGVNLSNSNLSNTDFTDSILTKVNLTGANLQNSNFSLAKLAGADLTGANLDGTNFDKFTVLCNTKMSDGKPDFSNCRGKKAVLENADLEKMNLYKIDFTGSMMHRAYLGNSILRETNLSYANLWSADLTGADLTGANITSTKFNKKTKFCNTKMTDGKRVFKNCHGSNLRGADLKGLNLNKINFKTADLTGADLRGSTFFGANFTRANLTGVKINDSELSGANLDGAILCKTSLTECRGSDYINANKIIGEVKIDFTNDLSLIRGQHYSVYAIDSDIDGNLFIGNYRKNEIIIMDENLNKKSIIKNTPMPHGITVDSLGNIYVSTFMKGRVLKFDKNLKLIPDWDLKLKKSGLLKQPIPLTHDEFDNIYIGDYLGDIIKVDSEGNMVALFEKKNKLNSYHGLSIYKNKLYAAARPSEESPGGGTIRVFDLNGKYIKDFESPKDGIDPLSVKIIFNKYFLVPNFWKEQLFPFYLFNEDGKVVGYLGEVGNKNGEFLSPTNFVYNPKGYIYVVEDKSNRIQKIKLKELAIK